MKNEEWRTYCHIYEVSNLGRVRRAMNQARLPGYLIALVGGKSTFYYHLYTPAGRKGWPVQEIMGEVWPELGFKPDPAWRAWLKEANSRDNKKIFKKNAKRKQPASTRPDNRKLSGNLRPCAGGCGRMITNYRCSACWDLIRRRQDEYCPSPAGYALPSALRYYGYQ